METLHPIISQRLAQLGILTPEDVRAFLNPDFYTPASPYDLPDMAAAVARVRRALDEGQQVLVWGDFDVDGQTSTALLVSALRDLGGKVRYHIPNRFSEGHGIHLPTLAALLAGVDLLLTCDTGVAAHDAIAYALSQGVETVVTDHHTLPDALPNAVAVVNPMRLAHGHPLRELPGVGIAYQLVRALFGERSSRHLLDLVAIGIVADVMVLRDDTRYWLQCGLRVLREAQRPAIRALLARAGVDPTTLNETTIGFMLAPRLNALGRLADANPAVELLTTDDATQIAEGVNMLEGLNLQRRFLTEQVYAAAQTMIQSDAALLKYAALVVAGAGWHTGVVGIVASRLVEEYARPVFVLSENDGFLSGSGRSIAGVDLVAALRTQANLLMGFGGHTMAAGLRLSSEHLLLFRRGISQAVRTMRADDASVTAPTSDAVLPLSALTLAFADEMDQLAPFGNGNPLLRFVTPNVTVQKVRQLGRSGDHLEITIVDEAGQAQAVKWWSGDASQLPQGAFDLIYSVRSSVYKDKREVLAEWIAASQSAAQQQAASTPTYSVQDYRHAAPHRIPAAFPQALVWREGTKEVQGVDRTQLTPRETLVMWSVPPSQEVWSAILQAVQPQTLVLIGQTAVPLATPNALLAHIGGLLKFALRQRGGQIALVTLAAATGHTERTIQACLGWFNAHSEYAITLLDQATAQVTQQAPESTPQDKAAMIHLNALLAETAAYRRFWLTADWSGGVKR